MSSAKTAEPIEMPFGRSTHVGSGSRVLDGGPDLPTGRGTIEGDKYRPIVTYALRTVCLLPRANVPAQRTQRKNASTTTTVLD